MAKPQYDNNGNVVKKPFKIKIAGFSIGLGQIIALALVVGVVLLSSWISAENKRKEDERRVAERMAELEALKNMQGSGHAEVDVHAQVQESLRKKYGDPPEGFEWSYTGEPVPLANDDEHNCEDVVYMYLRALSILDFSTAARYSDNSTIIADYQRYYDVVSESITDYYRNFLRKQFKSSLTSLEVLGISDVAVFADGSEYLTIKVFVMDLTDKDFWIEDRDELFETLRIYKETEDDVTKVEQAVYEYIFSKYEDGTVKKSERVIELVVSKQNNSGWLVSGDRELNAYLQYEQGVDVARFILNEFNDWYISVTLEERVNNSGGTMFQGGSDDDEYEVTGEPDSENSDIDDSLLPEYDED